MSDVVDTDPQKIEALESRALAAIDAAADERALDEARVAVLGKKGELSLLMRSLGGMSAEQRQVMGPALNGLKDRLNAAFAAKWQREQGVEVRRLLAGRWRPDRYQWRSRPPIGVHGYPGLGPVSPHSSFSPPPRRARRLRHRLQRMQPGASGRRILARGPRTPTAPSDTPSRAQRRVSTTILSDPAPR